MIMNIQKQFEGFMITLDKRLLKADCNISNYIIDHVCFRVNDMENYNKYKNIFKELSLLVSNKIFHDIEFQISVLKEPLVYKDIKISVIELSEPGGLRDFQTGFEHIEFLTKKGIEDLVSFDSLTNVEHFEVGFIWDDLIAVKVTDKPVIFSALLENNSIITLTQ